jgi:predicted glycoside hydrolase/deacetylase ChbG (UPF0249 family)
MKRLVIRADDAGSSRAANRAILQCARDGLARNVSLMAPGPCIEEAAQVLVGLPNVDFGLHVTLNAEWDAPRWKPCAPREQVLALLDEDGAFTRAPNDLFERGVGEEVLGQIETEVVAQLQRLRSLGFTVTYLDEHMGVGWLPGLRERLQTLARREGLLWTREIQDLPPAPDSATPQSPLQVLASRVEAAPDGDWLFITHPAFDDEEMRALSNPNFAPGQIADERRADRQLLLDAALRRELQRQQVLVARYSEVLGSGPADTKTAGAV